MTSPWVCDVGGLVLAMIVATAWTVVRRLPTPPMAMAWLLQRVVHLADQVGHPAGREATEAVGLVVSLVAVPAPALFALWTGHQPRVEVSRSP